MLVYPGGDYETFRPSWHGDQIEFGGRQGFVKLALEHDVPIVPVVSIGGQETALFVTRGERAAKLIGLDKLTRIKVQVLPPIDLRERFGADPDPDAVYDEVTAEMQDALSALDEERTLPVVG